VGIYFYLIDEIAICPDVTALELKYTNHTDLFYILQVGSVMMMITHKKKASRGAQVCVHANIEPEHTHNCTHK